MLLKTNPAAKLRRLCAQYVHNAIYFTPPSVKNDERPGRRQCAPQAAAARPAAASGQQPEPQPLARMPPFTALSAAFRGLESRVLAGSFSADKFSADKFSAGKFSAGKFSADKQIRDKPYWAY